MAAFFKISKFFLYLAPLAVIIVTPSTLFPFIVGKYVFFKIAVELALLFFVWGWATSKFSIFSPRTDSLPADNFQFSIKQPLAIAVSAFVFIFVLAGFAGINPGASFWSNFERGEGSFLLLHFYVYFLLLLRFMKNENDWRRFFTAVMVSGSLAVFYGVAAGLGISGFAGVSGFCERFAGSLGNPAYLGTFLIFMIFYAAYLLVSGDWRKKSWRGWKAPVLIFLIIYFFVFLLFSQTRGALLGLGTGIIAALFYLVAVLPSRKWRWILFGAAAALLVAGAVGVYYRQYIDLAPWCAGGGGNRILDVSFEGETINTRFALWRQSIEMWKERPILGWGPENFAAAFEKYYNPVHTVWFDRAHNIFFDYLVMTGGLGLLSFISIFVVYYWKFFLRNSKSQITNNKQIPNSKSEIQNNIINALLFALPIAYLVQGLVLFDVLPIYINLFLFLAFSVYKFKLQAPNNK